MRENKIAPLKAQMRRFRRCMKFFTTIKYPTIYLKCLATLYIFLKCPLAYHKFWQHGLHLHQGGLILQQVGLEFWQGDKENNKSGTKLGARKTLSGHINKHKKFNSLRSVVRSYFL